MEEKTGGVAIFLAASRMIVMVNRLTCCNCPLRFLLQTELMVGRSCLPNAVVIFSDLSSYPASQEERPVAPRNLLPAHTDLLLA